MRLGDWRIVEKVALPVANCSIEALGAIVHALEDSGRCKKLERAAHREPFVRAMLDRCAATRVAHKDPQLSALTRFDLGEPLIGKVQALFGRGRSARPKRRHRGREGGKEEATAAMMHV